MKYGFHLPEMPIAVCVYIPTLGADGAGPVDYWDARAGKRSYPYTSKYYINRTSSNNKCTSTKGGQAEIHEIIMKFGSRCTEVSVECILPEPNSAWATILFFFSTI